MVELELGAVDLGLVKVEPVVATDDEVEERAEDDTTISLRRSDSRWLLLGSALRLCSPRCRSLSRW
jgi:hypothetical protein